MSEVDAIKEDLGWLKFWAGVLMAALLAVVACIFNNIDMAKDWQKALVVLAALTLILLVGLISRTVKQKINRLKEL
jgi:molybdenum cofactor biosynthesis enzyme